MRRGTALLCTLALLLAAFFLTGCQLNPFAVVDEYNHPLALRVIGSNNALVLTFSSVNDATDFLGFNVYISTESNTNTVTALLSTNGTYPTHPYDRHTLDSVTIVVTNLPDGSALLNGTEYFVGVSAYGTNEYATYDDDPDKEGLIETPVTELFAGIPRPEGSIALNNIASATSNALVVSGTSLAIDSVSGAESGYTSAFFFKLSNYFSVVTPIASSGASSGYAIQDLGAYDAFSDVTLLPEAGYQNPGTAFVLANKHIYALTDGTYYIKLYIETFNEKSSYAISETVLISVRWAFQPLAARREL